MMRAIRIARYGGPEVLRLEELPTPTPGPGQLLVRLDAAGVNFIDVYQRSGQYPVPLPYGMGLEGAGIVVHYTATREELLSRTRDVFGWIAARKLQLRIGATFPLGEAAEAHRQLEARKTTGKVLLLSQPLR